MKFRDYINEARRKKSSKIEEVIIAFHGTSESNLSAIKKTGLKSEMQSAKWYMLATDFDSALFHSKPVDDGEAYIVEFAIPVTNDRWEGDPWLWPPFERSKKSKWYAIKETIPKRFIKKVHKISHKEYLKIKQKGF